MVVEFRKNVLNITVKISLGKWLRAIQKRFKVLKNAVIWTSSSRESHIFQYVSTNMRPKNVHRNIFPNALTSFAAEDRSRDHFNVILLSVCINDNVRWNHQPCRTPSCCQTFDIFLHCDILFNGSVDCEYCSVYNSLKD